MFWKRKPFFNPEEKSKLVAAIGRAEEGNRGELRVHVERRSRMPALERAQELYAQLGMRATEADTGVLLYICVDGRKAAVWAGEGIHREDDSIWQEVVQRVATGFGEDKALDGLCDAIERIGDELRRRVPGSDNAGDELPNQVSQS